MRSWILLVALLVAGPVAGQEGPNILQFSLSNPGARSLGLGGAFVALADDATAAFANPAGLVQLTSREISMEARSWSYETPFTAGGRALGPPTGVGLDTFAALRTGSSSDDLAGISYLSFVQPFRWGSLAFFRHQLANFEADTQLVGLFATDLPGFPGFTRVDDVRTRIDLELVSYGLAAGFRVNESLSLGIAVSYNEVDLLTQSENYTVEDTIESFFGPTNFEPRRLRQSLELTSDDSDVTLNLGARWEISPLWMLGAVYRMSTDVDMRGRFLTGPRTQLPFPPGTLVIDTVDTIEFPDVFGVGAAFRSRSGKVTASIEWDRVGYSKIIESLDDALFNLTDIVLDDADEIRVGFEYVLLSSRPLVALRTGAWIDPDHQIQIRGTRRSIVDRAVFRPGDDELHLALGVGVAFDRFQLDFGVDLSDQIDTLALSGIFSF